MEWFSCMSSSALSSMYIKKKKSQVIFQLQYLTNSPAHQQDASVQWSQIQNQ